MQSHNQDALKHAKTLLACSLNNIFTDPPYFAGSVVEILDNLLKFKGKGKDFMSGSANSWNIEELGYYEELAKEWFRAMKYGGYVVMYSLDRYSWIWSYLMVKAGFEPCQTMYWANISNFPKASAAEGNILKKIENELRKKGFSNIEWE